jgi:hypothetical protein
MYDADYESLHVRRRSRGSIHLSIALGHPHALASTVEPIRTTTDMLEEWGRWRRDAAKRILDDSCRRATATSEGWRNGRSSGLAGGPALQLAAMGRGPPFPDTRCKLRHGRQYKQ